MSNWLLGLAAGLQGYMGARMADYERKQELSRYKDQQDRYLAEQARLQRIEEEDRKNKQQALVISEIDRFMQLANETTDPKLAANYVGQANALRESLGLPGFDVTDFERAATIRGMGGALDAATKIRNIYGVNPKQAWNFIDTAYGGSAQQLFGAPESRQEPVANQEQAASLINPFWSAKAILQPEMGKTENLADQRRKKAELIQAMGPVAPLNIPPITDNNPPAAFLAFMKANNPEEARAQRKEALSLVEMIVRHAPNLNPEGRRTLAELLNVDPEIVMPLEDPSITADIDYKRAQTEKAYEEALAARESLRIRQEQLELQREKARSDAEAKRIDQDLARIRLKQNANQLDINRYRAELEAQKFDYTKWLESQRLGAIYDKIYIDAPEGTDPTIFMKRAEAYRGEASQKKGNGQVLDKKQLAKEYDKLSDREFFNRVHALPDGMKTDNILKRQFPDIKVRRRVWVDLLLETGQRI